MHVKDHLRGDSSLVISSNDSGPREAFKVRTQTLDGYVKENLPDGTRIDLIKIDTEGSENLVFEKGQMVLAVHRPVIVCEVIKGGIENIINEQLKHHNYTFFRITENGLIHQENINPESLKEDYFCVPA